MWCEGERVEVEGLLSGASPTKPFLGEALDFDIRVLGSEYSVGLNEIAH